MVTIRVRGKLGVTRLEVMEDTTLIELYNLVNQNVKEAVGTKFILSTDPSGNTPVPMEGGRLKDYNVRNGEMVFLIVKKESLEKDDSIKVDIDEVDRILERQNGRINRKKDPQYCKHGDQGMCSHCQPLEPYDPKYAEEKNIKHLSFHSYLKKLTAGRNSSLILEEPDFSVKKNCTRHAPYPAGICSQCQPSAISLNPQPFRFTDHVEFDKTELVESFLSGWRSNGLQKFSWLYGRYVVYDGVPLGIKAVVSAIYEPPQDGSIDGFQLLDDPLIEKVDLAAKLLGLQRVGMMYTDLKDDGTGQGKVENKRSAETFFLSSAECCFIAQQQLQHLNPCRYSPSGYYGSKFITVVLSGDESNNIALHAYQVSLTAMAMVKADLIEPTTDPSLMMVNTPTKTHYVPDIIYKYKNEYGSEVQTLAKPTFPVDYLIVSLSHGFPKVENPLFTSKGSFPPPLKKPTTQSLKNYLLPIPTDEKSLSSLFSNFNFFIYLYNNSGIPDKDLRELAISINDRNLEKLKSFLDSQSWKSVMESISPNMPILSAGSREDPISLDSSDEGIGWNCPHCTFGNTNITADHCEVCGLPREWHS